MAGTGRTYQQWNDEYNDLIRAVARVAGADVTLNDVAAAWEARLLERGYVLTDLLLADGLHLSEAGHDLYCEFAGPVVMEACRLVSAPDRE
jgi:lysophospholipase L1-like esterase